jgi:hypothetical protein
MKPILSTLMIGVIVSVASCGEKSPTIPSTTSPPSPTLRGLNITAPQTLEAGLTAQLQASTVWSDGSTQALAAGNVSWQLSDTTLAGILGTGVFAAFQVGVVDIRATYQTVTSEATVRVTPPPQGVKGVIVVGTELTDTFRRGSGWGIPLTYRLIAPSNGTLAARLSWTVWGNGAPTGSARFLLAIGDMQFEASDPNWSPVVGRVTVSAGQTYLVRIDEAYDQYEVNFDTPFGLTTAVE